MEPIQEPTQEPTQEPIQEPLTCTNCTRGETKVECESCEEMLYCSAACQTADFESHRYLCKFKEKSLSLQCRCAVYPKGLLVASPTCGTCHGIRYCSTKCMNENIDEHKLLCQAYVELPPRPSKNHRLYILLPFRPDFEQGFVWRRNHEAAMGTVAPGHLRVNLATLSPRTDEDHRWITAYYVRNSDPNVVLGDLVAGRPTGSVTGSLLSFVTNTFEGRAGTGDALPSDLHKILHHVALLERQYGPVKIALTPHEEAYYGEDDV